MERRFPWNIVDLQDEKERQELKLREEAAQRPRNAPLAMLTELVPGQQDERITHSGFAI